MANPKTTSLITISDLNDAPIGILSNESFVLQADANGVVGSFAGASTTFSIRLGGADDSANWTVSAGTPVNITGSLSGKTYTVTGMSADTGYVDLTATKAGFSSIVKRFNLAKAKQGTAGVSITSTLAEYKLSASGTTTPSSWDASASAQTLALPFLWTRIKINYSNGSSTYVYTVSKMGDTGGTGPQGVSVSSITPYYQTVTKGAAAPAAVANNTVPPAPWQTTEPTYTANTDLYRTDRVLFSNGNSSCTPVTKVSAWAAVDGIQVGGRNLLPNTKTIPSSSNRTNDTYLGLTIARTIGGTSGYADTVSLQTIAVPDDTIYTVSFYAKASESITIINYFYNPNTTLTSISSTGHTGSLSDGSSQIALTTEWKRYWTTWTQSATTAPKYVLIGRNMASIKPNVTVEIAGVKLEKGNKATDWTAAPEDIDNKINETADLAKSKSALIFSMDYADRETLLPLDAGTIVFFANQKQTYRYEGYIEGVHEWSNVTYELVGPLAQELSDLQGQLGTRATVFTRATAPTTGAGGEAKPGDMWVNTSQGNKVYILFGGSWSPFNQSEFDSVQDILDNITKTMTGGSTIWRQDTAPTSGMVSGDLWFNTSSGMNNQCKKYNGSSWVLFDFTTLLSYVETKSDSWKNADQLYSWIKDSSAYKSALESKLDVSVYNTIIAPMINKIPGMDSTLSGWSQLEAAVNNAALNDIDLYNKLNAYNVYLEYQPATPGQPNSDYLKIARRDPTTGIRSGFEIRITNNEIGFFLTRVDGSGNIISTDKLAYANGLEFRMINATVTKQINLIPTEAPLGAAGGQQYFQLLATTDGAFQGLWVTDT